MMRRHLARGFLTPPFASCATICNPRRESRRSWFCARIRQVITSDCRMIALCARVTRQRTMKPSQEAHRRQRSRSRPARLVSRARDLHNAHAQTPHDSRTHSLSRAPLTARTQPRGCIDVAMTILRPQPSISLPRAPRSTISRCDHSRRTGTAPNVQARCRHRDLPCRIAYTASLARARSTRVSESACARRERCARRESSTRGAESTRARSEAAADAEPAR